MANSNSDNLTVDSLLDEVAASSLFSDELLVEEDSDHEGEELIALETRLKDSADIHLDVDDSPVLTEGTSELIELDISKIHMKALVETNRFSSSEVFRSLPLIDGNILVSTTALDENFAQLQKLKNHLQQHYSTEQLRFSVVDPVQLEQLSLKAHALLKNESANGANSNAAYKAQEEFEKLVQHGYESGCSDMQMVWSDQLYVDYRLDKVMVPHLRLIKDRKLGLRIIRTAANNNEGGGDLNFEGPQSFRFNVNVRDENGNPKLIQTRAEKSVIHVEGVESSLLLSVRLVETSIPKSLEVLNIDTSVRNAFQRAFNVSKGLVLVTGPTGSGKTTLLGGAFHYFPEHLTGRTVEDPVELNIHAIRPNVTQSSEDKELWDLAVGSMLRQDPDLVMLGEVRTKHQAETLIVAASTGHIAVSTLHTNDSIGIISRFIKMGVPLEDFMEFGLLQLLVATRLVPKTCSKCSLKFHELPEEKKRLVKEGFSDIDVTDMRFGNTSFIQCENTLANELDVNIDKCECNHGYKGVHGITEFIEPSRALVNQVLKNKDRDLDIWLKDRGWRSMLDVAKSKCIKGIIDPFAAIKDFPELLHTVKDDPKLNSLYEEDE